MRVERHDDGRRARRSAGGEVEQPQRRVVHEHREREAAVVDHRDGRRAACAPRDVLGVDHGEDRAEVVRRAVRVRQRLSVYGDEPRLAHDEVGEPRGAQRAIAVVEPPQLEAEAAFGTLDREVWVAGRNERPPWRASAAAAARAALGLGGRVACEHGLEREVDRARAAAARERLERAAAPAEECKLERHQRALELCARHGLVGQRAARPRRDARRVARRDARGRCVARRDVGRLEAPRRRWCGQRHARRFGESRSGLSGSDGRKSIFLRVVLCVFFGNITEHGDRRLYRKHWCG